MSRSKLFWWTTAVFLVLSTPAVAAKSPSLPVAIVAVVRESGFADRISALGTLSARESVDLTANVTETIDAIRFVDGERVRQGQILVEMTRAEEEAGLVEAQSSLEEAERQYQRTRQLAADSNASQSDLDLRRREWETARARLSAIESQLADRMIRAPFDGVVGLRQLSVGALVTPGTVVTTLDDDRVMKLDFTVPSLYLGRLRSGLNVEARTRAYGDRVFTGTIKSVDSRVDTLTRSVQARALIANADGRLRPGMFMRVEVYSNPRQGLAIPEEALVPLGERQFVLTLDADNVAERREVRIAAREVGIVEVVEGLKAGERVIVQGTTLVQPGQKVHVMATATAEQPLPELLKRLREHMREPMPASTP